MKWIGQHIWDFISRFRSDVYLEGTESGTIASGGNLGLDSNNKIVKANTGDALSFDGDTANGILTYKDADEISVESNLTYDGTTLAHSGTLDIDAGDDVTIDAADEITITSADRMKLGTSSTDGHIWLYSAHTDGLAFWIHANQGSASEVQIDAGILDINVTGTSTIDTTELTITGNTDIRTRKFAKTADGTHFEAQGDILYLGNGSTTQGDLCYLKENGEWGQADADGAASGDDTDRDAMGMLAIALGTDPDSDGMLLRGVITMDDDMGDVGNPIYVSTTAGAMTNSAPTASGDFVRVLGYCLDDDHGQIWFNPDSAWVEIA